MTRNGQGLPLLTTSFPLSTPASALSVHRDTQHSRLVLPVNTQPQSHSTGLAIAKASAGFPGRDSQAYFYLSWQYKLQLPSACVLAVSVTRLYSPMVWNSRASANHPLCSTKGSVVTFQDRHRMALRAVFSLHLGSPVAGLSHLMD